MKGILVSVRGETQRWCISKGANRYELEVRVFGGSVIPVAGGLCWKDQHYLDNQEVGKHGGLEVPRKIADEFNRYFTSAP